jgi:acetyltransferase-like isoleucine patch superfamily enzyme
VDPYCFFGVNATLRDGLRIGEGSLIAMGACVTRDTEPWSVYKGNPARKSDVRSTDLDF